jgi:hypothetical protein
VDATDDCLAAYIDGKRNELQEFERGNRRMWSGGRELADVTPERIAMLKRQTRQATTRS